MSHLSTKKTVSRKFQLVSDKCVEDLKRIKLKPKSGTKVNWGINAYNEWRNYRLHTFNYEVAIYYANLNNLETLTQPNLNSALCHFIPEVAKQKANGSYPRCTLYQMVCAIKNHFNINKLPWILLGGREVSLKMSKQFLIM